MIESIRGIITTKKADSAPLLNDAELEATRIIIRAMIEKHFDLNKHLIENLYKPLLYSVGEDNEIVDVSSHLVSSLCVFPGEGEYDKEFRGIFKRRAKDLGIQCPPAFGRNAEQLRQREPLVRGIINEEIRNYVQRESGDELSLDDLLEGQRDDNASRAG